jgi:hypothetical protein
MPKTDSAAEVNRVLQIKIPVAPRDGLKVKEHYHEMAGVEPGNCAVESTEGIITFRLTKCPL